MEVISVFLKALVWRIACFRACEHISGQTAEDTGNNT